MTHTHRSLMFGAAFAAIASAWMPAAGLAEANIAAKQAESHAALTGTETIALAASLYRLGIEQRDALYVIAAAQLSASVQTAPLTVDPATEPVAADAPVAADSGTDSAPASTAEMIAAARELAAGDATLVAMIDAIGTTATRAPVRGTLTGTKVVGGRASHYYDVELRAGERTFIDIDGGGDGDLDLFVYDENSNLVCSSLDAGDRERCVVAPRWRGWFRVYVRNLSRGQNTYNIVMQ